MTEKLDDQEVEAVFLIPDAPLPSSIENIARFKQWHLFGVNFMHSEYRRRWYGVPPIHPNLLGMLEHLEITLAGQGESYLRRH